MVALIELRANRTAIKQLPYSFGLLKKFKTLSLSGCKGKSSESWMNLSDYNLFEDEILMDLGSLSSLEQLNLSGNNFRSLPHCISSLPKLDRLVLDECTSLRSISELPSSLGTLYARGCSSLQRLPNV
jgi:Leucine-rich repeat (LRR) protein